MFTLQYFIKISPLLAKPGIERVHALADILRLDFVVIATKPMHRLQICPIVHNYHSPSYIQDRAVVWAAATDTHVHDQYTFRIAYDSRKMWYVMIRGYHGSRPLNFTVVEIMFLQLSDYHHLM